MPSDRGTGKHRNLYAERLDLAFLLSPVMALPPTLAKSRKEIIRTKSERREGAIIALLAGGGGGGGPQTNKRKI